MSKAIAAVSFAAALFASCATSPAHAFDILALRTLGFSPDGRYFAFMQYAPQWEASKLFAETFVIDTSTDRYVQGAPVQFSIDMKEDADSDNIGPELKAFLAGADKRNAALIGKHKIGQSGVVLVSVPEARVDDYEHTTDQPPPGPGSRTVTAKHPKLGELTLKLETREIDWPKGSRLYAGKQAPSCAKELDTTKGVIFRLTLERNGRSIVLQDDKTIPASRHCVSGYGIAQVQTFDRPDGKVTLAVLLGMKRRGFEGEDRVFLAVTRVLNP
jgi:predicted secreted protein